MVRFHVSVLLDDKISVTHAHHCDAETTLLGVFVFNYASCRLIRNREHQLDTCEGILHF